MCPVVILVAGDASRNADGGHRRVVCFVPREQFSRTYLIGFDITPTRDRIEGRVPFQFRNFTGRSGYHSAD